MSGVFSGARCLMRFTLRRDRVRIIAWLISLIGVTAMVAVAFTDLFTTEAERIGMAETMRNPAMTAMVGPGYGLDDYTVAAMMSHEMLLFTCVAVAIMNIAFVIRHTRREEENGRTEVIRSLPSGRLAGLAATLVTSTAVNTVLALLTGLVLPLLGVESLDPAGSLMYGAVLGTTGIFFSAASAVFAQLCAGSRMATGLSYALLGLCYMMRASGDVGNELLSRLSPLGLVLRAEVYVNNYLWPLLIVLGLSVIVVALAFYLSSIRDMGAGFITARSGRRAASPMLRGPLTLALRLTRGTVLVWAAAMLLMGAVYGSVFGDIDAFMSNSEFLRQLLSNADYSFTTQFAAMLMSVMSMIAVVPALIVMLRLRGEERRGRTEHLLARSVSRARLMTGYALIAFVACAVMMLLAVIGLWAACVVTMEQPFSLSQLCEAGLSFLPAMWCIVGLAAALCGLAPNSLWVVWAFYAYSFFAVYIGRIMGLPEWTGMLSPFANVPQIPINQPNPMALIIIGAVALALFVAGYAGFTRRELRA